jgi:undecaprenyl-diphosphatase
MHFDDHVRALVHAEWQPHLTQAMIVVTTIGSTVPVVMFTLLALAIFRLRDRTRDAVVLAVTIIGAAVVTYVLKLGFHRARPTPYFSLAVPNSFSFPSGHTLVAICFYGMLAHLISSRIRSAAIRLGIWICAVLMILLIGFSRIYLGVHYASDVIAAYAAGTVWILTVVLVEPLIGVRRHGADPADISGTTR